MFFLKKFFLYTYALICIYFSLIIVDIIIPRYDFFNETARESKERIKKFEVIASKIDREYFSKDPDLLPISYPVFYELMPFRAIVNKHNFVPLGALPNQKTHINSEGLNQPSIYLSDRFGFRNNDSLWDDLSSIEVVVIGDSAVAGHGALNNQTITSIFNSNNSKTINLGIGGYSGIHYEFLAKIFIPTIKPKKVLVVFHGNDNHLIDQLEIHSKFIKKAKIEDYIQKDDKIKLSPKAENFYNEIKNIILEEKITNYDSSITNIFIKFKKYILLTNIRKFTYNSLNKNLKPVPSNISAINEVIKQCRLFNCKPYFALIKSSNYWDPDSSYEQYEKTLSKYLKSNFDIDLIKSNDVIDQKDLTNWGKEGPHFSPKGYKLFSEHILKSLK